MQLRNSLIEHFKANHVQLLVTEGFKPGDLDSPRNRDMFDYEVGGVLMPNVPMKSIYGSSKRCQTEWLFKSDRFNVPATRIECKSQDKKGSVDEKYPYTMFNLLKCEEKQVIVYLGGDGISKSAKDFMSDPLRKMLDWLGISKLDYVNSNPGILDRALVVFEPNDMTKWINSDFPPLKGHKLDKLAFLRDRDMF